MNITAAAAAGAASSITERAYRQLRGELLACRLKPGERLNINKLCATLGVSLGAVREALSRLTSEGLVLAEPQRGFSVAPISAEDLIDLTHARIEVEALCLRRTIAASSVEWETNLVAAAHRLNRTPYRATEDRNRLSEAWSEAHRAFHEALVANCDNRTLLRVRRQLFALSERYRRISVLSPDANRDLPQEHQDLVDASLNRQADRAVKLMTAHLSETGRQLLQVMERTLSKTAAATSFRRTAHRPESGRKGGRSGPRRT